MALLISVGCGAKPAGQSDEPRPKVVADTVLYNGDVRTMDPAHPHATAIAILGDEILVVGDRADMPEAKQSVDLAGKVVIPGLVDAHCHLYGLGVDLERVSVRQLASEAATIEVIAKAAKERPATEWLVGRGWDQNRWPGQKWPTKASIDAAVSDRPVLLERVDGHAIWVNSRALAVAGITAATKDPEGGKILRDAKGEPTGVLVDNATALVESKIPEATAEVRKRRLLAAQQLALAAGITGVHEMGIDDGTVAVYEEMAVTRSLGIYVHAYLAGDASKSAALRTRKPRTTGTFSLRGVKYFADGALGSRGARLYEPYDDDPQNRGLWVTEPATLKRAAEDAVAGGWQVAVHAIGDAGIGSTLDAFENAQQLHPGDHRLRIEHVQVIAPNDVERMVATHAIASMQPTHATSDMPWAESRVGKERIKGAYAWRTMLDRKIPLAFGSDFPVEEVAPLLGIYAAVTRQDAQGKPAGGWYPEQRMTLDEAIAGFTTGAAYAAFSESRTGMIAPKRLANLTIFDQLDAAKLLDSHVEVTIVDGFVKYDRATIWGGVP